MNFDELPHEVQAEYSKNRIKRHIPGFVDDEDDLIEVDFTTVEELMNIEFVRRWTENEIGAALHRIVVGREGRLSGTVLMAEMKDGSFWVLGFLKKDVPSLPSWDKAACDARKAEHLARKAALA